LAVWAAVEIDDAKPWACRIDAVPDDVGEVAFQCCLCERGGGGYGQTLREEVVVDIVPCGRLLKGLWRREQCQRLNPADIPDGRSRGRGQSAE